MNNDALLPLVDNMLKCRQDGFNRVNAKYGTNIKVSLNSSWESNAQAITETVEKTESETDDDRVQDTE